MSNGTTTHNLHPVEAAFAGRVRGVTVETKLGQHFATVPEYARAEFEASQALAAIEVHARRARRAARAGS